MIQKDSLVYAHIAHNYTNEFTGTVVWKMEKI